MWLSWNSKIIFVSQGQHFHFENYVAGLMWKRSSSIQSQLLKLKPHTLSLSFLTANTLGGSIFQKWLFFLEFSSVFNVKFTKLKYKSFSCTAMMGEGCTALHQPWQLFTLFWNGLGNLLHISWESESETRPETDHLCGQTSTGKDNAYSKDVLTLPTILQSLLCS